MPNRPKKSANRRNASIKIDDRNGLVVETSESDYERKMNDPIDKSKSGFKNTLEDSPAAYSVSTGNITKTFSWLGMKGAAIQKLSSEFDYIDMGNLGITKNAINSLAENIGISRKYMSENIFDVSVKTMERKGDKAKLDKKISSHAIEIAKVVQHAWQVFRDEGKVKRWMSQQNRALNNKKPVELFDTLSGIVMVDDILGRIEEGVYS